MTKIPPVRSRERFRFFHPNRDLAAVFASASEERGAVGIDALALLNAAIDHGGGVAQAITRAGSKPADVKRAAALARHAVPSGPGLTDDAKSVVEAALKISLDRQQNGSAVDLFEALVSVDSPAREVLRAHGIDESVVRSLRDGNRVAFGFRFALERLLRLKPDRR